MLSQINSKWYLSCMKYVYDDFLFPFLEPKLAVNIFFSLLCQMKKNNDGFEINLPLIHQDHHVDMYLIETKLKGFNKKDP